MKAMHLQYDGVDWIARLVRFLVDLVQDDLAYTGGTAGDSSSSSVADWAELLAVKPRTYLRLSLAMDLSMSSGRFPDNKDFLARLDGLRLGRRSARALCSPTVSGPPPTGWRPAEMTRRNGQQQPVATGGDGSPLALDMDVAASLASNNTPGDALENASFMGDLERSGQQSFDVDADLDRFTCLPDDLDDFFDPVLGDLAADEESSTNKSFDAGIDNGLSSAAQEAMQM